MLYLPGEFLATKMWRVATLLGVCPDGLMLRDVVSNEAVNMFNLHLCMCRKKHRCLGHK